MDRLPTLIAAVAVAALACNDGGDKAGSAGRQRVNSVAAEPTATVDPAAMCDRFYRPAEAPSFHWPETVEPALAKVDRWRWINVWATWCKPCVEELPRLATWQPRLASAGADVALVLVSADESDDEVAAFRADHPKTPASNRLADPDGMAAWIEELGVKGATLPVHIFVDPANRVRCVRASAVEETDFAAVEALLTGS
jgi:thiol-disulfide isomerase/thioredoxin